MAEATNILTTSLPKQNETRLDLIAQTLLLKRLTKLKRGRLKVVLPSGERFMYGEGAREATIHIHSSAFFRRLISSADVGAGESYMAGEWSSPDLVALTRLFLDNDEIFSPHPIVGAVKRFSDQLVHWARKNSLRQAPRNIAAHYDLSNDLYELFLDDTMTYSSAYFDDTQISLAEAQQRKYQVLAEKAGISPGQHVLEIGCGWGGFAEFAATSFGCRVTGITLSEAQAEFARQRMKKKSLDHLVEIEVIDYREVRGSYDAIVSVEMLEAVGHEYLGDFFAACERLLRPEGRVAIQVITMPDQLYNQYRRGTDFIRRHVFPGGHLPSLHALQQSILEHSSFVIQDVENIAASYAETLRRWRSAFMNRLDDVISLGFDDRFCRMWEFYLAICEAGFDHGKTGTLQIALARPGSAAVTPLSIGN